MRIAGENVLITGAAVRVGAHLARSFSAAGARVFVHYRCTRRAAEALAAEIGGIAVYADLSVPDAAGRLLSSCGAPVGILINNASAYRLAGASYSDYFRINCIAPVELCVAFAAAGGKTAVNILDCDIGDGSVTGGYIASRRALRDATLELASRYAGRGIRFNAVAPGPVLPPVDCAGPGMTSVLKRIPLRRPVSLDDLADTVLFCCRCDSLTGEIINVDCGAHLSFGK